MAYIEVTIPGTFEARGEAYPTGADDPELSRRSIITLIRGIRMVRDGISWEQAFDTCYGYDPELVAAVQQFFLGTTDDYELLLHTALDRQPIFRLELKPADIRRIRQTITESPLG